MSWESDIRLPHFCGAETETIQRKPTLSFSPLWDAGDSCGRLGGDSDTFTARFAAARARWLGGACRGRSVPAGLRAPGPAEPRPPVPPSGPKPRGPRGAQSRDTGSDLLQSCSLWIRKPPSFSLTCFGVAKRDFGCGFFFFFFFISFFLFSLVSWIRVEVQEKVRDAVRVSGPCLLWGGRGRSQQSVKLRRVQSALSPALGAAALSPAKFSDIDITSVQLSARSCLRIIWKKRLLHCLLSTPTFNLQFSAVHSCDTSPSWLFSPCSGVDPEILNIWKATLVCIWISPLCREIFGEQSCVTLLYNAELGAGARAVKKEEGQLIQLIKL